MSYSAIKCWPGPASWCASSSRALGGGCLPTQLAHTVCFHRVTFPDPLIILSLLDNTFLSSLSTSFLSCELPLNTIFQQQLPSAQVIEMLCSCTREHVGPLGVWWHPRGSAPITPKATKGFPSKAGSPIEDQSTLPFLLSLLRSGGHVTVFGPRWASVLTAQHACHRKGGFATHWTLHPLVQASEHFTY